MAGPSKSTIRSYTAGRFLFTLDGSGDGSSYIKSVDGGNIKSEVITEQIGNDLAHFKSAATVGIEPISLEVGMEACKPLLEWIGDSWRRNYSRRNGSIMHADFNGNITKEQWFTNALISETTIPKADASDKSPAYLNVKLQPEGLELRKGSGSLRGTVGTKQGYWTPSSFRFSLDKIDCTGVSSVDSFTVKQKHKELYYGGARFPQIEPTGIEFPNISLTVSAAYADDFIKWHDEVVVKGRKDTKAIKNGALIFYDPTMSWPLMTVQFTGVGIYNLAFDKSEAGAEAIKKMKAELYVEKMDIVYGFGLE